MTFPTLFQDAILGLISLAYGLISAVSGGGGGVFVVPALVSTSTEPHNVLLGSVFTAYLVTSTSAFVAYARKGLVDYRNGIILAIPSIPGVIIGTFLESRISDLEFKLGLGLLTIGLSITLYLSRSGNSGSVKNNEVNTTLIENHQNESKLGNPSTAASNNKEKGRKPGEIVITDISGRVFTYSPKLLRGALTSFVAGLISGTFGAGAVLLIVPAMILIVRMPTHIAIATSRIILMGLNLSAFVAHVSVGAINYLYAGALSIGGILGIYFGARLVFKMSPALLTKIVVMVFIVLGSYLIISSI